MLVILWMVWGVVSYFVFMFGLESVKNDFIAGAIGAGAVLIFMFWLMMSITNAMTVVYYY